MSNLILKEDIFINFIKKRVARNKNCIICVTGDTGSGKTYAAIDMALRIAKHFQTHFSINDNVAFCSIDFIRKTRKEKTNKPGTPFIFEEAGAAGAGTNSKQWYSEDNQGMSTYMQTSRSRNHIYILTLPRFTTLARDIRELTHLHGQMKAIVYSGKYSLMSLYKLEPSEYTDKIYRKFLRAKIGNRMFKYDPHICRLPPQEVIDEYEEAKYNYQEAKYDEIEEKNKIERKKLQQIKRRVDHDPLKVMYLDGLSYEKMGQYFGLSDRHIRRKIKELQNSGELPTNR